MAKRKQGIDLDAVFRALGNARRRAIVELVSSRERSAAAIASEFDCSWPAIARHLVVLRNAGILRRQKQSQDSLREVYAVDRTAVAQLHAWADLHRAPPF